jgi:hypothetical protein
VICMKVLLEKTQSVKDILLSTSIRIILTTDSALLSLTELRWAGAKPPSGL